MAKKKINIEKYLSKAQRLKDRTKQQLLLAAIVTKILEPLKITPVLVGGAAVQFYTFGGYTTEDIDLVLPSVFPKKFEERLTSFGFKKEVDLRHWFHPGIPVPIEFPPSPLQVGYIIPKTINKVRIEGLYVHIIRLEDIILDRLIGAQEWRSEDLKRQAEALITTNYKNIDWAYLHSGSSKNKVLKLLEKIQRKVKRQIRTGKGK